MRQRLVEARKQSSKKNVRRLQMEWEDLSPAQKREREDEIADLSPEERRERMRQRLAQARQKPGPNLRGPFLE